MKNVAIVSEYNPFHRGHAYQIKRIREEFGADTRIIAIMGGHITQRGEPAIADKYLRARVAVDAGVSLVLELPFPFCAASADVFARAAVSVADSLSGIDILSFGSESGDVLPLLKVVHRMESTEFKDAFASVSVKESYARALEQTYSALYGNDDASILRSPNNILAIAYLRALHQLNSRIMPHTVKREGDYADLSVSAEYPSAAAIRNALRVGDFDSIRSALPTETHAIWEDAFQRQLFPTDPSRLSNAFLAFLRIYKPNGLSIAESSGGLTERLCGLSMSVGTMAQLYEAAATKRYTNARIRRAVWNLFLEVTSFEESQLPYYTQLLAMDSDGRSFLSEIRKQKRIEILTKPADYTSLPDKARAQAKKSVRADSIFSLAIPSCPPADAFLRCTPYYKNGEFARQLHPDA
ncbi:MAG: nucleotidyltransferase family protein [Clostridia bacterium]|nr:nucleotidyltransferase family protein [Clostridia bacterium]